MSKPDLKSLLGSKMSSHGLAKPELTVIVGSAIFLVFQKSTKGLVSGCIDYTNNIYAYVLKKLDACNANLVFVTTILSSNLHPEKEIVNPFLTNMK